MEHGNVCQNYKWKRCEEHPWSPPITNGPKALVCYTCWLEQQLEKAESAAPSLPSPPDLRPLVRDAFNLIKAFEDRRCGRSKVFPDFDEVTTWLARAEREIGDGDGNK